MPAGGPKQSTNGFAQKDRCPLEDLGSINQQPCPLGQAHAAGMCASTNNTIALLDRQQDWSHVRAPWIDGTMRTMPAGGPCGRHVCGPCCRQVRPLHGLPAGPTSCAYAAALGPGVCRCSRARRMPLLSGPAYAAALGPGVCRCSRARCMPLLSGPAYAAALGPGVCRCSRARRLRLSPP